MKILILHDKLFANSGGASSVVLTSAFGLKKIGHDVIVVTTVSNKKEIGEKNYHGLRVICLYSSYHERWRSYVSLNNPFVVRRVVRIIQQVSPDVVHAHNIHFNLSYRCLKIAKKYCSKVFITSHDAMMFCYGKLETKKYLQSFEKNGLAEKIIYKCTFWGRINDGKKRYNPIRQFCIKHYLKYVNKIFAVSQSLKEALEQNNISKNVDVLYNSIELTDWEINDQVIRNFKQEKKISDNKVIYFGGRLSESKGTYQLFKALQTVAKVIPNFKLLTTTNNSDELDKIAKKYGLENYILSFGWACQADLNKYYHCSDVIITPSICFESFNLINLEAMACKKPVITSCFGGPSEVVINNETGFIINPFEINIFADKIIKLLNNDSLRQEFGEAGYKRVCEHFKLDYSLKGLLKYYE